MSYFKEALVVVVAVVIGLGTFFYNEFSFKPISARIASEEKPVASEVLIGELRRLHRWTVVRGWLADSSHWYIFENRLVQDLYQKPYAHFSFLKDQLRETALERDHKILWIKLSQCLEPNDYISLIDIVLESGLSASEKSQLVDTILSPSSEWGTAFSENYLAQPYHDALEKILANDEVAGSLEGTIEYIRSGTGKSFVDAHRKIGEYVPRPCRNP